MNKTIPKKKKSKKAKWLFVEALQIAKERRNVKSKGERERYIQLNVEFQRIARRDKKAFFNEQCIKLEENNRRGKTRDLFRKIEDIKGTFHLKKGTIKDRNGRDLVDAKEIKKRWKNTQKNCIKKILMNWITMMMWSATQSQTFWKAKINWALGSTAFNKASGVMEFQ